MVGDPTNPQLVALDESAISPVGKFVESTRALKQGRVSDAANRLYEAEECMQILLIKAEWHRAQARALEGKYGRFDKQFKRYCRRVIRAQWRRFFTWGTT